MYATKGIRFLNRHVTIVIQDENGISRLDLHNVVVSIRTSLEI